MIVVRERKPGGHSWGPYFQAEYVNRVYGVRIHEGELERLDTENHTCPNITAPTHGTDWKGGSCEGCWANHYAVELLVRTIGHLTQRVDELPGGV